MYLSYRRIFPLRMSWGQNILITRAFNTPWLISSIHCNYCNSVGIDKKLDIEDFVKARDTYISKVISNFIELRKPDTDTFRSKRGCHLNSDGYLTERNDMNYLKHSKITRVELPSMNAILDYCFNNSDIVTNENNSKSNITKEIERLLEQGNIEEAYSYFETNWKLKLVPNYVTLRKLASIVSIKGSSVKLQVLQDAAKYFYPRQFAENMCFVPYLCEAIFLEGRFSKAFAILSELMAQHPCSKKPKEIAAYLMNKMESVPDMYLDEAFKIVCNFIKYSKQDKPAFALWSCLVESKCYNRQCMANSILEFHPALFITKQEKLNALIQKGYENNDIDLLHRLTQSFLKVNARGQLTLTSSSLLSHYCLAENVAAANEVISFAHEQRLVLSKNSIRMFVHLLNKYKMATSPTFLAYKYGYKMPKYIKTKDCKLQFD